MKTKIQNLFIALALLIGIHQANATILLSDNFDSNSLDLSKWTTNTAWNAPFGQVIAVNQRVEFTDRGYLNTVTDYDPAASGGLLITGTWTILHSAAGFGESEVVVTRSSGVPSGGSGNVSDGVLFVLQPPENGFQPLIVGLGGAIVTGYNQISNTLSLVQGDTVNFTITDDGTNLTFNVAKAGNPASAGGATAVCTSHLSANKITFYNRENNGDSSALDNVVIQTIQPPATPVPFIYTTNNGAITITGYTGTNGTMIIPATINGYPVTSIGSGAFAYTTITSVTIPNSITSIGDYAFYDSTNLTSVTIPNSVTNTLTGTFEFCRSLTNVVIPTSITSLGNSAFYVCTSLKAVYFQGNSPTPSNDGSVFQNDASAIAYYLPGTTGWEATFDGIPTSVILPPPPAVGISTYGSQPTVFFPTTGTNYVLQMTTNLASGNWVTVTNGIPISGLIITNPPAAAFFRLH